MTWPLAAVIVSALVAVVVTQVYGGTTNDILLIILTVLGAMNAAELREVKSNTNGGLTRLMEENANYRRQLADITNQALNSPALGTPQAQPPAQPDQK